MFVDYAPYLTMIIKLHCSHLFQCCVAFSGVYKHVGFGIVGYFVGRKLEKFNAQRERERLLVLEDYVRLHPEDFPEERMFAVLIS